MTGAGAGASFAALGLWGGFADPEGEPPWAMQIVVRMERADPPSRTRLCAAAGVAIVRLLTDPRAQSGGEWSDGVDRWLAGRIRKHCRRARGVAWERVQSLPGVTASVDGAEARAFVPTAVDEIPAAIAKLQLSGSEPPDPDRVERIESAGAAVIVSLCPAPFLPLGKAAAAVGHATQLSWWRMDGARRDAWQRAGFPVAVESGPPETWAATVASADLQVVDGGLTVVEPGTVTAVARWP